MAGLTLPATESALRKYYARRLNNDIRMPEGKWPMIHLHEPKGRYPLENICTEDVAQALKDLKASDTEAASYIHSRYQQKMSELKICQKFEVTPARVTEKLNGALHYLSERIVQVAYRTAPAY